MKQGMISRDLEALMSQRDNRASGKIVNTISPAPRDTWEEVLQSDPLALETQSSAWAAAAPACATAIPGRAHLLDLEGGWEEVWSKRFRGTKRTAARRAERLGVTVECGTSGRLVPEFYQLLEQEVARWARLQHEPYWLAVR